MPDGPKPQLAASDPARDTARLLDWLGDHEETCPRCGYSLNGLTVARCPECSAKLTLGVRDPGLRLGPFITAIVGLAMGMGFDGVIACIITVVMVFLGPPRGAGPGPFLVLSMMVTGAALCGGAILTLLRLRSAFLAMTLRHQWLTAAAVWALTFAAHVGVAGRFAGWW